MIYPERMTHVNGRVWLSLLLFAVSAAQASAQAVWEPPTELLASEDHRRTVRREPITRLRVSGVTVILEEATLRAVQSQLGGTIGHRGDASELWRGCATTALTQRACGRSGWSRARSTETLRAPFNSGASPPQARVATAGNSVHI